MVQVNLPQLRKNIWGENFSGVEVGDIPKPGKGEDVTYQVLRAYYDQNGLYQDLMATSFYLDQWHESMQPLYNPCHRSVEFFVAKILPGMLPEALLILTDNDTIVEPIRDIWRWSNLNQQKPVAIRWLSIYGDLFIHPVTNEDMDKVYLQFIRPEYVTDWTEDRRGNVTSIRIDIPVSSKIMHTEFWTAESFAIWEHNRGASTPLNQLDGLVDAGDTSDFGIDFVPFVHIKFRDVGDKHGVGAFAHSLDKIDEANRMATRLHQMLFRFNKPIFAAMANANDSQGQPLPAPVIDADALTKEDSDVLRMPGMTKLEMMIPDLKYTEALAILQDQMTEIEKDLPELAVVRLRELGELSGRAARIFLTDAEARAREARVNFEQGLIRAELMALTIGKALGIWTEVGEFDSGENDHQFKDRPIFEITISEKATVLRDLSTAGITGVEALRLAGWDDDEIPNEIFVDEPETGQSNEFE